MTVIIQSPHDRARVLGALQDLLSDPAASGLQVAVAYANERGADWLVGLVTSLGLAGSTEIVVTLDMGITRRAALQLLLDALPGRVRTVETNARGTFHTKAFVVRRGGQAPRYVVGSANLTDAALTVNAEAVVASKMSNAELAGWEAWWNRLWAHARPLSARVISRYQERRPPSGCRERIADRELSTDEYDATVDETGPPEPENAGWLVIDWGGTGEYVVQFELPRAAAQFFVNGTRRSRHIRLRFDGHDHQGNVLTYYKNHMWRINLDPQLPPAADGSIKSGASLFTRIGLDAYELRLLGAPDRAAHLSEAMGRDATRRRDRSLREVGWS